MQKIRRPWKIEEIETLKQQYGQRVPISDIASKLGRSHASVKSMIQRLGLHRPMQTKHEILETVEPLKPADKSLSITEAFRLWSGLLLRLQKRPITKSEIKFLGVATKAVMGYIRAGGEYGTVPGEEEEEREHDYDKEFLEKLQQLKSQISKVQRRVYRVQRP